MSKLITSLLLCLMLIVPNVAFAVDPADTLPDTTPVPNTLPTSLGACTKGEDNLGSTITYLICVVRLYVTAIAVLIIMVVGLMYILGALKPDAAGAAKTILNTTIVGLVAMYLVSFIINFLALTKVIDN